MTPKQRIKRVKEISEWVKEQEQLFLIKWQELQSRIHQKEIDKNYDNKRSIQPS